MDEVKFEGEKRAPSLLTKKEKENEDSFSFLKILKSYLYIIYITNMATGRVGPGQYVFSLEIFEPWLTCLMIEQDLNLPIFIK
jgi:hypothetical protein